MPCNVSENAVLCTTPSDYANPESIIAIGFGSADVYCDDWLFWSEQGAEHYYGGEPPESAYLTFGQLEEVAKLAPWHKWKVCISGPLWGATYERQSDGKWPVTERDNGFA